MEVPGFVTLLYHLRTLPAQAGVDVEGDGLPWQNKVLAALFVMHYAYRAVVFPFLRECFLLFVMGGFACLVDGSWEFDGVRDGGRGTGGERRRMGVGWVGGW